jgi:toxin ParE1/3/4
MSGSEMVYELSLAADSDLDSIFDYTAFEFGNNQAVNYLESIESAFLKLTSNSELGKQRNEIKSGLRSLPDESHIVFYRVLIRKVRIVRVLHKSQDIEEHFSGK